MVFDVFLKILHIFKIIVVGVVTNNDVGVFDNVFQKTKAIVVGKWEAGIFIGSVHSLLFLD